MGITGLLKFVKDATDTIHIKKYSGQVVAIDTYCWLHRGSFACADKLAKKEKTNQYVKYCMKFITMLESYHIKPILVFDGCRLPSKELVEQGRQKRRKENLDKGRQFLREGKINAARDCFTKCISVTPAMALEVMEAARLRGIDCIVAPYEADAQLAYFSKIGLAQAIITEDSDLLCFGCKTVIFKMDETGLGREVSLENLGRVKNLVGFTPDLFRQMCILSGCDYLPSIKGVGLVKACKALKLSKSKDSYQVARKLHQYIKGLSPVDPGYGSEFERADRTFLYQLVFDPVKRKIIPLNEYPPELTKDDLVYAGPYLSDDKAFQIALGNVDINTKLTVSYFNVDVWLQNRKAADNIPSIWGSKSMKAASKSANNEIFIEQVRKKSTPDKHSSKIKSASSPEKSVIISASDVLDAVTNYDSTLHDLTEKSSSIEKEIPNIKVDPENLKDLLQSYSSERKHKKKRQEIVKSRFFASPSATAVLRDEFDVVPETDVSSNNISSQTENTKDLVLDDILSELSKQSQKPPSPSPGKRKNPFSKQTESTSKRRNIMNSSAEGLEKFSHKRKKKRLSKHALPLPSDIIITDENDPRKSFSDEDLPRVDDVIPQDDVIADEITISPTKDEESCSDPVSLDEQSLSGEEIPILDNHAKLVVTGNQDNRKPLSLVADENGSVPPIQSPPATTTNPVISVSSGDEEEEFKTKPTTKCLGMRRKGHFKCPVKLNLSKYFTSAKASGLKKSNKKKHSSNTKPQPSITSFFTKM